MEGMSRSLKLSLVSIVLLTCVHIGTTQDDGARLSAAVHEILLPIMKEIKNDLNSIKDDLNSVKNDLSSFNKTVNILSVDLEDYKQQTSSELSSLHNTQNLQLAQLYTKIGVLDSKLDSVNASMREDLRAIESQLEEHQTQTISELAGLHLSFQSNTQQLTHLSIDMNALGSKLDTLDLNLNSVNASMREELRAIDSQLEEHHTQTTSELAGLQRNVTSELHTSIESYNEELITKIDTLDSKFVSVNATMREKLRAIESQLEEHQTQTVFTLDALHSFLQSHTYTEELTEISTKMDILDSKLDSVNNSVVLIREDLSCIEEDLSSLNETMNRISEDVEEHDTHTTSELMNLYEYLQANLYTCGDTGGWRRVVYLNMTDPNTNCPSGWQLTSYSKRTCGKVSSGGTTCDSVTFPVSGGGYTRVCGRIIAYQVSHIDAFEAYDDGLVTTIDGAYVAGVSLTHGSPRQHIWTFAAGSYENDYTDDDACPCDATINISIPPFVGGDYFCESGVNSGSVVGFHPDDPLWDGQNCIATSTCCSFNSPPYFTKQLPSPTTDDIEARLCWLDSDDQSPIEFMELYVQ